MQAFFERALSVGATRAAFVGSDCPTLPLEDVQRAFQRLESHAVVFGPALDGGYDLLGVARRVPPISGNIPRSTPKVWEQTLSRRSAWQASFAVLREWYDGDYERDLCRLRQVLIQSASDDPRWRSLLDAVDEVV